MSNKSGKQAGILADILDERARQEEIWGEQNHNPFTWLAILEEEVGEYSKAALHKEFGGPEASKLRTEATHIAAVALAIVECLDRGKWEDGVEGRAPTWISVEDGLPKESEWVMICDERGIWNKGQCVDGDWWKYPGNDRIRVTHYMPILFMPESRVPPIEFTEEELLRGL